MRSSASCAPVVIMTFSGLARTPMSRMRSQNTRFVSTRPSVEPYCSATARSSSHAARVALRMAACGKSDTSGMPPDSEMMLGFDAAANKSRTAEERIFTTRLAILSLVWSNVR